MRLFISLTAAIAGGIILFLMLTTLGGIYYEVVLNPEPGNMDFLLFFMAEVMIIPIMVIILIFVFYYFYSKLNVPLILFNEILGLWLTQLVMIAIDLLSIRTIGMVYLAEYLGILPIIFFVLGYLSMKKRNSWLAIYGFITGTFLGLLASYGVVILLRWMNNSLTSFFWLDTVEKMLLLIVTAFGAWIGNVMEKKRKVG